MPSSSEGKHDPRTAALSSVVFAGTGKRLPGRRCAIHHDDTKDGPSRMLSVTGPPGHVPLLTLPSVRRPLGAVCSRSLPILHAIP